MEITNEALAERLEGLTHLINERFVTNENSHANILEHTRKINGTVLTNSGRISKLEIWQNRIIGGLIVSNILVLPVLFVVIKSWLDKN